MRAHLDISRAIIKNSRRAMFPVAFNTIVISTNIHFAESDAIIAVSVGATRKGVPDCLILD